jgi:hypothetical protein
VYVPFSRLGNEYVPEKLAVVLPVALPVKVRVAPLPAVDGVMLPETLNVAPAAGTTSAMLRLYLSVVGEVSFMVTTVPLAGIGAFRICIQYVSPLVASD